MITLLAAQARSTQRLGMPGLLVSLVLLAACSGNSSAGLGALPKAMGAADEISAIQTLRTIATAEGQLKATRGSYGDFEALTQAGYLDPRFAGRTPNLQGYLYTIRSEEHTSELQSLTNLVCRLLLEKKKKKKKHKQ